MKRGQWVLAHNKETGGSIWINLAHAVLMLPHGAAATKIVYADDSLTYVRETPEALLEQLGGDE